MSTGATDEQIERAARDEHAAANETRHMDWPCDACLTGVRRTASYLVPPDHRIIRADENHLTPELRAALAAVHKWLDATHWGALHPKELRVIDRALAEFER